MENEFSFKGRIYLHKENIIIQAEELVSEIQYENLSIKVPIGWEELEAVYKATVAGTINIPDPMIPPTFIMVASIKDRTRFN